MPSGGVGARLSAEPLYVSEADLRLRVGSPMTNAGAFERDALFGDDFELGDAGAWSVVQL